MIDIKEVVAGVRPRRAWRRIIWDFSSKKPLGAIGGVALIFVIFVAIFAPIIATHDPTIHDAPNRLQGPNTTFFFGTDNFGRDVFSRLVYGARVSLYVGMVSVAIGTIGGTTTGIFTAYLGGKVDILLQRVIDAFMGFPALIIALALVSALGASANNVAIAISAGYMPRVARIVRSQALTVKQEDYILAARAIGARALRIMTWHVLPNCMAPVIVLATGYLGTAIVVEAGLSYLGLGVPPPDPSWGQMLYGGTYRYQEASPWLTIFPGLALTITVLGFNLWGDAIRDVLDPRLRGT